MKPKRSGRFDLRPVGVIRSTLKKRSEARRTRGLRSNLGLRRGLHRMKVGDEVLVITWFHQGDRDVLQVRPRSDPKRALTGVFATRSPGRPNPLGLHPVTVKEIAGNRLKVEPIEAIDGTPVVDIKSVLTMLVSACHIGYVSFVMSKTDHY
jgi:tRNA-Thr(GGU) m(6)t(6)A37 methyltransferase TsaA